MSDRRWTLRLCAACGSRRTLAVGAYRVRCEDCRAVTESPEVVEVMPVAEHENGLDQIRAERDEAIGERQRMRKSRDAACRRDEELRQALEDFIAAHSYDALAGEWTCEREAIEDAREATLAGLARR